MRTVGEGGGGDRLLGGAVAFYLQPVAPLYTSLVRGFSTTMFCILPL